MCRLHRPHPYALLRILLPRPLRRVLYERGCERKNMVGRRLTQLGMRWSVDGATATPGPRCCGLSGVYGHYWAHWAESPESVTAGRFRSPNAWLCPGCRCFRPMYGRGAGEGGVSTRRHDAYGRSRRSLREKTK